MRGNPASHPSKNSDAPFGIHVGKPPVDEASRGHDTDVDGVFNNRDGGGSCRLAMRGDYSRLEEAGSEGDRTRDSLSIDVDMKV